MAKKAFTRLFSLALTGDVSEAVAEVIVFDDDGSVIEIEDVVDPRVYQFGVPLNSTSTLNSIKTSVQNRIIADYGFTPTFIWLDDKGLF